MIQRADPRVIEEFKKRRSRRRTCVIIAVVGICLSVSAAGGGIAGMPREFVDTVAFGLVVGVVLFSFVNWRCPACDGYLGKGASPKFCRKCGTQLQS